MSVSIHIFFSTFLNVFVLFLFFTEQILRDAQTSSYSSGTKVKPHPIYPSHSEHLFPINISPYRYASAIPSSSADHNKLTHPNMPTYTQTRLSTLNLLPNQQTNNSPSNTVSPSNIIKPISLPVNQETSSYTHQISKHWIWNSNFFYPSSSSSSTSSATTTTTSSTTRSVPFDGFMPYSSNISELFSTSNINNKSRFLPKSRNYSDDYNNCSSSDATTKTIDLSQQSSEANSDDSVDTDSYVNDDDVSGSKLSASNMAAETTAKTTTTTAAATITIKKKNPYSIEELLKKPDKKRRIDSTTTAIINTFQPAIIIHDRHRHNIQQMTKSDDLTTDDSSQDDVKFDKNNVAIDVCD